MKQSLTNLYSQLHTRAIELARRAPIPARIFGPPKGIINDIKEWVAVEREREQLAEDDCWYQTVYAGGLRKDFTEHPQARALASVPALFAGHEVLRQPEAFAACIPHARVLTRTGIVISPDDRVFQQSCIFTDPIFMSDIEYNTLRPMLKPTRLSGSYILMASRFQDNYYHWLADCVSRLCIADRFPEVPVLLPKKLTSWQRESLKMLGIAEERWRQLDEGCYEADRLYFPFTGHTGNTSTTVLQQMRLKFAGNRRPKKGKRLYTGRLDAVHRRVVNEDEVVRALEREGFTNVVGSRLSFAEQVELFSDAEVIIGIHGAGLANLFFAPPEAVVVEVLDEAYLNPVYYLVAASLEQDYWYMLAENQSLKQGKPTRRVYDDINVPVETLLETLRAALSR